MVGRAAEAFHAPLLTAESLAVDWVHVERIHDLPLHPGFAATWERVREIGLTRGPPRRVPSAAVGARRVAPCSHSVAGARRAQ